VSIQNKNKYIERNLCVTLFIYQESLHDARSTECNMYEVCCPLLHFCLRNGTAFRLLYFAAYEILVVLEGRVDIPSLEKAPHSDRITLIFIS
jgi:hypothetical protein